MKLGVTRYGAEGRLTARFQSRGPFGFAQGSLSTPRTKTHPWGPRLWGNRLRPGE
jgi:hypothetical protein